ncbi:Phosphoserine phosphatase RsbU [Pontiella desulfatans]|uniref:Phosphoserine phosphatase RsbU n=1 Tax=Pontiella desulfatans TaxID=2750659 RepID=A0A6C2UAT9_PONDE|nr:GAF domain-containing SpoIIE family protein phosphatase [Pontiella desulfatans]VGO17252.1 Phosphoserine phosphatase RsbU [Pontiella desulfatans]
MHGFLLWLTIFLDLLLPSIFGALLYISYRRRIKLRRERDILLQEKEAALGFVHNVGEVFADSDSVDMTSLLARVLHYAVRTCKASAGAVHLVNTKTSRLEARSISGVFPPPFEVNIEHLDLDQDATLHLEKLVQQTPLALGKGLIGEAAVLGNSILVEDAEMDSRVPQLPVGFLRIRTLLIVPMRFGNHTIGVMTLVNRTNGEQFALSDLNLAQALAAQASVPIHYAGLQETLEEKRELDRGMQIAQQIQHSLLPQELPALPSVELAAFNHPAMDIGGDYYDFINIDDKHIGLAIADVSGKGIGGALMMAVCRSVLRINAENVYDPSSMLCSLNQTLSSNLADDMFISMLYMVLNLDTHQLSYARAGHEAPIIIRSGEPKAIQVETSGIAIGLVDNQTFGAVIETHNISLLPGDLVVSYTDGVTEAMNSAGDEWGTENLIKAVERMANASAPDLLENIHTEVLGFTGDNRQSDDMTMLALKIKG